MEAFTKANVRKLAPKKKKKAHEYTARCVAIILGRDKKAKTKKKENEHVGTQNTHIH